MCVCVRACMCAEEHLMMITGEQLWGVWVDQREGPDRRCWVWIGSISGLKQKTLERRRPGQDDCGEGLKTRKSVFLLATRKRICINSVQICWWGYLGPNPWGWRWWCWSAAGRDWPTSHRGHGGGGPCCHRPWRLCHRSSRVLAHSESPRWRWGENKAGPPETWGMISCWEKALNSEKKKELFFILTLTCHNKQRKRIFLESWNGKYGFYGQLKGFHWQVEGLKHVPLLINVWILITQPEYVLTRCQMFVCWVQNCLSQSWNMLVTRWICPNCWILSADAWLSRSFTLVYLVQVSQ